MRQYDMPADTREKEKSIGGVLTFEQGGCIGGGTVIGFGFLLLMAKLTGTIIVGIIFLIPFPILGVVLAFKKKMDMPIYRYWLLKRKFDKKTHKLVHINEQKPVFEGGNY